MFEPFRGTLFDPAVVSHPGAATSPPYDVIDDEERARLIAESPYNVVRLLLPDGGEERYQRAATTLDEWRTTGALVDDPSPRLYLYRMRWSGDDGARVAHGVVGALAVTELGDRVLPHEETMSGIRADRLAVLESTQANLDPIVALSASPRLAALLDVDAEPRVTATAAGVEHTLSDAPDELAAEIVAEVGAHTVSIADGHHRYTTALAHAEGRGEGPWRRIMAMVAPAEGSGLTVAPYHRLLPGVDLDVERLERAFAVTRGDAVEPSQPGDLVLVGGDGAYHLTPRTGPAAMLPEPWREASAAVARELLYPLLGVEETTATYTPDLATALEGARRGEIAVLVAPVTEHAIAAASEAGLRFPQKTTFFTPKPRAGLVLRLFAAN